MPFPVAALGANGGAGADANGLKVNRTLILSQSTPTQIKTGPGNIYGIYAIASGTEAKYIQYFSHGGTTLGTSTPTFEVGLPAATSTISQTGQTAAWSFPIGIPIVSNATTSGIWIAAGTAMSTGPAVAASNLVVYTLYA